MTRELVSILTNDEQQLREQAHDLRVYLNRHDGGRRRPFERKHLLRAGDRTT
jgi:hypothetical protein